MTTLAGIDLHTTGRASEKAKALVSSPLVVTRQQILARDPDSRITVTELAGGELLSRYCSSYLGLGTGDMPHYMRFSWELLLPEPQWTYLQGTVDTPMEWGGCEAVVSWDSQIGRVRGMTDGEREQIHNQDQSGQQAWRRQGVAVGLMRSLKASLYTGFPHEKSLAALIPQDERHLAAIWCFVSSSEFYDLVRQLDKNVIVANGTLVKVPFDLGRWR